MRSINVSDEGVVTVGFVSGAIHSWIFVRFVRHGSQARAVKTCLDAASLSKGIHKSPMVLLIVHPVWHEWWRRRWWHVAAVVRLRKEKNMLQVLLGVARIKWRWFIHKLYSENMNEIIQICRAKKWVFVSCVHTVRCRTWAPSYQYGATYLARDNDVTR